MIDNKYLCEYAVGQIGRPYWMSGCGHRATKAFFERIKAQYKTAMANAKWEGDYEKDEGEKVHDCCGLIKGACWCQGVNSYFTGGSEYQSNGCMDWSVEEMFKNCIETGEIKSIPEVPGVLVFTKTKGHVGIYIGNGYVVEARGRAYGVQKNKLSARSFTHWGMLKCIRYTAVPEEMCDIKMPKLQLGSSGEAVKTLQRLLIADGYGYSKADGAFGAKTDRSVREYQEAHGLEADGKVWALTWTKILRGV